MEKFVNVMIFPIDSWPIGLGEKTWSRLARAGFVPGDVRIFADDKESFEQGSGKSLIVCSKQLETGPNLFCSNRIHDTEGCSSVIKIGRRIYGVRKIDEQNKLFEGQVLFRDKATDVWYSPEEPRIYGFGEGSPKSVSYSIGV